jgi:hypothetical protein
MKSPRTLPWLGALALAAIAAPAAAQGTDPAVAAAVDRLTPRIVEIRHDLHQNPELSNRETRTAGVVAAHLRWGWRCARASRTRASWACCAAGAPAPPSPSAPTWTRSP